MYVKPETSQEIQSMPDHRSFKSRIGAGVVAGCLALSMMPAVALAAPGQGGPQDMGGQQQMMQAPQGQPDSQWQGWQNQSGQQGQPGQQQPQWQEGPGQAGGDGPMQPGGSMEGPNQGAAPEFSGEQGFPSGETAGPGEADGQQLPAVPSGEERDDGQAPLSPIGSGEQESQGQGNPGAPSSGQGAFSAAPGFGMGWSVPGAPGDASGSFASGAPAGGIGEGQDMSGIDFSAIEERIIAAIPDDDVRAKALAGNQDVDDLRPAIPDGEVNVQQIIDTIRHALLLVNGEGLQEPGASALFEGQAPESPESESQMPGSERQQPPAMPEASAPEAPEGVEGEGLPMPGAPEGQDARMPGAASSDTAAPEPPSNGNAQPSAAPEQASMQLPGGDDTSGTDLFQKILEVLKSVFGLS